MFTTLGAIHYNRALSLPQFAKKHPAVLQGQYSHNISTGDESFKYWNSVLFTIYALNMPSTDGLF